MELKLLKKNSARRRGEPKSMLRQILYGVGALLSVVILVLLIRYITRLSTFTISDVVVEGGETISHDEVRARIDDELRGDYLSIIPHRFAFLYPHDAILASIQSIPRIHDITIVRKDRTSLTVTFDEYMPYALWCATNEGEVKCYFLDAEGFAFAPSPALTGGALVRHTFEEQKDLGVVQVMPSEEFSRIHAFLSRLQNDLSFRITDVIHTKDNDLYFGINGGGQIRVAGDAVYDEVYENLKSVLDSKNFKHLKPGNFQYIDLRFGDKVFVNEELAPIATSTVEIASTTTTGM